MTLDHRDPDAAAFKTAVGSFASGVAVLTVRSREGRPLGMTATAFSSVSTDPLLVLVCVNREARTRHDIVSGGSFGVNLLAAGMEEHSRYCSSPGADKSLPAQWLADAGPRWSAPALTGSLAFLDCEVYRQFPAGTHEVIIGQVRAIGMEAEPAAPEPLVHFRRCYRQLAAPGDRRQLAGTQARSGS
ncbi:MAG TPA: flavin reductase family protein [Trebonia sp.]|jgi:flavin reductase (DIM6/NTAB) family NADH-FMN oxidoreductase RutF|nr:flavin reductase family protein [Trebonia sp.]